MLGESHDLLHEFPEYESKIYDLWQTNPEFVQLAKGYNEIDAKIRRLEELAQPVADETMEELKTKRVHLKDLLYAILKN